ncbi:hypothetical protein GQ457_14G022700 [Hibiscus cannabinus]
MGGEEMIFKLKYQALRVGFKSNSTRVIVDIDDKPKDRAERLQVTIKYLLPRWPPSAGGTYTGWMGIGTADFKLIDTHMSLN